MTLSMQTSTPFFTIMTLAVWRLRQSWLLLIVNGSGMLATVMLICLLPLFSQVTTTVGLRHVLQESPASPYLFLHANSSVITPATVQTIEQQLVLPTQKSLDAYLSNMPEFSLQTPVANVLSPNLRHNGSYNSMRFYGETISHVASHLILIRGHLPQENTSILEVAMTEATAMTMRVDVNSKILLRLPLAPTPGNTVAAQLMVHVVGIFAPDTTPFWQGTTLNVVKNGTSFLTFGALASNESLIKMLTSFQPAQLVYSTDLLWSYHLNTAHISSKQLEDLVSRTTTLQAKIGTQSVSNGGPSSLTGLLLSNNDAPGTLERFRDYINTTQVSVEFLTLQILLLLLFFLLLSTELLIGQQSNTIALLRSRGASRRQIVGALGTFSLGLAVLALLIGPPLALLAIRIVMQIVLSPLDQMALNTLSWSALLDLRWYALGAMLVAICTMLFASYRAAGLDTLTLRRETSRTQRRPLWLRLRLDLMGIVIMLSSYSISLYLLHSHTLDMQSEVLLTRPIALLTPIFLCVAMLLLSLRFFPFLLKRYSQWVSNARRAEPILALAQMARSPWQFVRITLLLAFAIAFACFTLILSASQTRHSIDVADYQTGADFSGSLVVPSSLSLKQVSAPYQRIVGVVSVTAGYRELTSIQIGTQALDVSLNAVDTHTFGQTTNWQQWNTQNSLPSLLQRLHIISPAEHALPVLIDATLWRTFHLSLGASFLLQTTEASIPCIVVGEIDRSPQTNPAVGGIMLDYTALVDYYHAHSQTSMPVLNYIWVRTDQKHETLKHVYSALSSGPLRLEPLYNRFLLAQTLQNDPLMLNLTGILSIGTLTTLLLVLLVSWLNSWINIETRKVNFVVMRALGIDTGQIAIVLIWEQSIVYIFALLSGSLVGLLLAVSVVPTLIFTNVPINGFGGLVSSDQFYALQTAIPIQIVFPPTLFLALGGLIIVCIGVLSIMIRRATNPSLITMLRLNED